MKKSRGRTCRKRRRKQSSSFSLCSVNLSHKSEYILLKKWLKERGFEDSKLRPAQFSETGRGLMATTTIKPLFPKKVESLFNYEAFRWAWCTINTRTVYMKHSQKECFSREPDTYALVPYLDLLNHNPDVQVKAAFNEKTRCYEIKTLSCCPKYKEVFICYGPHDNQRLLLEYGFFAMSNPHSSVHVGKDTVLKYLIPKIKQKLSILQEHKLLDNLTFGWDGPSWRLLTALKLLCLEADQFTSWKKVLLGEMISEGNEKKCLDLATQICMSLLEETQQALQKVSLFKRNYVHLRSQLTLVEALRMEELKILHLSAEILHSTTV